MYKSVFILLVSALLINLTSAWLWITPFLDSSCSIADNGGIYFLLRGTSECMNVGPWGPLHQQLTAVNTSHHQMKIFYKQPTQSFLTCPTTADWTWTFQSNDPNLCLDIQSVGLPYDNVGRNWGRYFKVVQIQTIATTVPRTIPLTFYPKQWVRWISYDSDCAFTHGYTYARSGYKYFVETPDQINVTYSCPQTGVHLDISACQKWYTYCDDHKEDLTCYPGPTTGPEARSIASCV